MGRDSWNGVVLLVANIRNGYKVNMKFTRNGTSSSTGRLETATGGVFYLDGDLIDF